MNKPSRLIAAIAAVVPLVVIGACSSDSGSSSSPSPSGSGSPSGSSSVAALVASEVKVTGAGTPQVTMSFPVPSTASSLSTNDLKEGSGPGAKPTSTVTVNYVGQGATTGKVFDSSYRRGEPAEFSLERVIPGWTEGMTGMKAGGERVLVIPGSLAYGARPPSPDIAPNETLVFYVQLVSISGG
ncbi:MAG: FKBP-type peptidyl-prolyl cis-trans isomerase [Candidatus Nanopelagicales bacterium]|nr:FKBP-type peptidyl-prolyl cis-trans isomerase [Candidatus Nanopelagicales bacterium]